jgi:hypothetical protein
MVEGLISRGDEATGDVIIAAFKAGARLDSWDEYLNRSIWKNAMDSCSHAGIDQIYQSRDLNAALPWDKIDIGVKKEYLLKEYNNALAYKLSEPCRTECTHYCGICKGDERIETEIEINALANMDNEQRQLDTISNKVKVLIAFTKKAEAIYLSHLNCITRRALIRAGYLIHLPKALI